jgi:rod shape-determining protein MreB
MRTQHNLFVGESTAEKIKSDWSGNEDLETPPEDMSVQEDFTGKPKTSGSLLQRNR